MQFNQRETTMAKKKSRPSRLQKTFEAHWWQASRVVVIRNIVPVARRALAKKAKTPRKGKTPHAVWIGEMSIFEREWYPGKAAAMDAAARKAALERAKKKSKASGEYQGPKNTVLDPRCGVHVAVMSDDKGTPEYLSRVVEGLMEFCEPGDFPKPLKGMEIYFGDRHYHANVRRDQIDLLYDKGCLSDAAYCAARELKAAYQDSNDVRYGSINMERTGNGRVDEAYIVERRMRAIRKYTKMLDFVKGGRNSYDSLFVMWFCCYGKSLNWIASTHRMRKSEVLRRFREGLEDIARAYLKPAGSRMGALVAEGLEIPDKNFLLTAGTSQG